MSQPESTAVGKTCAYCGAGIGAISPSVICSQCQTAHHAERWRRNGGCTTAGCTGTAISTRTGGALSGLGAREVAPAQPAATVQAGSRPSAVQSRVTMDERAGNTSGRGAAVAVPPEIRGRWNWGAFWLTWIWGIGHNTWIALIALIGFILPPVGLVMAIVLGVKGSEWAWQNRRFEGGVTQFRAVQRVWAIWGWVIFVLIFLVPIILVVVAVMMKATAPARRVPVRYGAASVRMEAALDAYPPYLKLHDMTVGREDDRL